MSITEELTTNVQNEIKMTLSNIIELTSKIKEELNVMNNLVQENGSLSTAVQQTNIALLKMIAEKNIDISDIKARIEGENGEVENGVEEDINNSTSSNILSGMLNTLLEEIDNE